MNLIDAISHDRENPTKKLDLALAFNVSEREARRQIAAAKQDNSIMQPPINESGRPATSDADKSAPNTTPETSNGKSPHQQHTPAARICATGYK